MNLRRTLLAFGTILLFFSALISCRKNSEENVEVPNQNFKKSNKELIHELISGKGKGSIAARSYAEFGVSKINDRLHFQSWENVTSFFNSLDDLEAEWDDSSNPELPGLDDAEKEIAGNPILNMFDEEIGFESLRRFYVKAFYEENRFRETLDLNIKDDDMATILNIHHEVQVRDTIYKIIPGEVMAAIPAEMPDVLIDVRNNGFMVQGNQLKWYHYPSIEIIEIIEQTHGCDYKILTLKAENKNQLNFREITLTIGTNYLCATIIDVNWGDGFVETFTGAMLQTKKHTYNSFPSPGSCNPFTISVTSTTAGVCTNGTDVCPSGTVATKSTIANICAPILGCGNDNRDRLQVLDFNHNGSSYRLEGKVEAQTSWSLFDKRKILGETYMYKRTDKLRPYSSSSVHLRAEASNNFYSNNCTTPNPFNTITTKKNRSRVDSKYKPGQEFQWTPLQPNHIYSNHYVDFGSGILFRINNLILQ